MEQENLGYRPVHGLYRVAGGAISKPAVPSGMPSSLRWIGGIIVAGASSKTPP
jgi:hypothetical protein